MIQRPKRRCSSMSWSMDRMTRHNINHSHLLHPGLAPDVLPLDPVSEAERVRMTVRLSLTIIQFTAHVILISNTYSQQAHNRNPSQTPRGRGNRQNQTSTNLINKRKAPRPAPPLPSPIPPQSEAKHTTATPKGPKTQEQNNTRLKRLDLQRDHRLSTVSRINHQGL